MTNAAQTDASFSIVKVLGALFLKDSYHVNICENHLQNFLLDNISYGFNKYGFSENTYEIFRFFLSLTYSPDTSKPHDCPLEI